MHAAAVAKIRFLHDLCTLFTARAYPVAPKNPVPTAAIRLIAAGTYSLST